MRFEKISRLTEICIKEGGNFYVILNGNVYCGIARTRGPVECPYCCKEKDINGLYKCTYEGYTKIRDMILYKKPLNDKKL